MDHKRDDAVDDQNISEKFPLNNKEYDILLDKCKAFVHDAECVYKLCVDVGTNTDKNTHKNNRKWLVIMRYVSGTKNNEHRTGIVDKDYAKFRGDKLKVLKIIDISNPNITKSKITNKYKTITCKYVSGEIVKVDDYDENIEEICGRGIHYFKTLKPAFCYGTNPSIKKYTGKWYVWHEDGRKQIMYSYKDGRRNGISIVWDDYNRISKKETYFNDKLHGEYIMYDEHEKECERGSYIENEKQGERILYNTTTDFWEKDNFRNELKDEKWVVYDENEGVRQRIHYLDGEKDGKSIMHDEKCMMREESKNDEDDEDNDEDDEDNDEDDEDNDDNDEKGMRGENCASVSRDGGGKLVKYDEKDIVCQTSNCYETYVSCILFILLLLLNILRNILMTLEYINNKKYTDLKEPCLCR